MWSLSSSLSGKREGRAPDHAALGSRARQRHRHQVAHLQPAAAAALLQGRQGLAHFAHQDREQPVQEGPFGFAGIDDHYFMIARREPRHAASRSTLCRLPARTARRRPAARTTLVGPCVFRRRRCTRASSSDRKTSTCSLDRRRPRPRRSTSACSRWLAVPLLRALKWLHGFVGN